VFCKPKWTTSSPRETSYSGRTTGDLQTMSDSLGPAHGIQECQGTYRMHMQARTKLYFEGLLSVPYHHSQQPARSNTLSDRKPPLGSNEFRHWLSETRFLKRDGSNGSPRLHPGHRNADEAKQQDTDGVADKQYREISVPHWIQTLDELFPTPADSDGTITDSPVVHTQEVTRMIPHVRGVADDYPSDHISRRNSTYWPCSTPRTFGPLWPEHVPYVAYSGRGAPLGDTQRRSRNMSNNALSRSPRKLQIRDLDRIWTRSVTSRDARRRTPSAAGDI